MSTLKKLLVVDDDPVIGKSFDRVLSGRGYAVVTASDGPEALRKIATEAFDAVYTDIRMPGMDGIAVAEHIRKNQPWLPVVIVSGYATAENEAWAKAAGVTAVLHKPLSPEMIVHSAREALLEKVAATPAPVGEFLPAPVAKPAPETKAAMGIAKRIALLVGAPLLGLAFVLVLPFAGLAMLVALPVWYGGKAIARRSGAIGAWAKNVALFLAAPVVGLAYVIAMPFVMAGMLVWSIVKAIHQPADNA
ncbi:MAG TPA: response regulator [Usitatibacteraceae bacterium]|nr:response regulator [Usitatibacteraceae bacterium]